MSHIKERARVRDWRAIKNRSSKYARNRNVVVAGSQCSVCVSDKRDEWLLMSWGSKRDGWRCLLFFLKGGYFVWLVKLCEYDCGWALFEDAWQSGHGRCSNELLEIRLWQEGNSTGNSEQGNDVSLCSAQKSLILEAAILIERF